MDKTSMVIAPGVHHTRILAMNDAQVILKGRLLPSPQHPRAMQWLVEAVALWQGQFVSAVLSADRARCLSVTPFEADWFTDFGGALYALKVEDSARRRGPRPPQDRLEGLGPFGDLKRLPRGERSRRGKP